MLVFLPTVGLLALAASGYVIRMWAVTAGYHRYFAHRAYKTSRAFQLPLAILGGTALQQGPLWWASWHRRHHRYADTPGDPHSPKRDGFWHAHVGWIFDGEHGSQDLSNVKDVAAFPELRWLDRHSYVPVVDHYMTSARQGFRWWELDVSYYSLRVLAWLGIVWDLRQPPARHPGISVANSRPVRGSTSVTASL